MDWNDLKFALAVARHGSLSAAARALGTTQPTVSRRLAGLERKTGVKLFERSKDGLTPTQLGAALTDGLDLMDCPHQFVGRCEKCSAPVDSAELTADRVPGPG